MDQFVQDLRLTLRQTLKHPSYAAIVIVTLGLAIGVNALIFSFVNFFVLRPLPFQDVSRLAMLVATHPERGRDRMGLAYADFVELRRDNTSFEDLGAMTRRTYNLTGAGDPRRVQGVTATASLFTLWGLDALHGRLIRPEDDRPGAPRVAVLSHGFWSRQLGADPSLVGQTLRLDGEHHTVVGVLTPEIEIGNLSEVDVWTALALVADPDDRSGRNLRVTGRLKPGVALESAAAELRTLAERQQRDHPATNAGIGVQVLPLRRAMTGANTWTVLALLGVAVALVLAVACANVANLMLARGAARQRETAVRAALGAGRARLVRQLLTEGAVLAVLGGSLGVLLAGWGLDLIRSMTFEPFFQLVVIDRRVLAFCAAVSLLTPLVFGPLPALQATGLDLVSTLKEAGRSLDGSRRRARVRSALVVGQLGLALALLLVAGLSVRMALAMQGLDLGFAVKDLVTLKTDLPPARYATEDGIRHFQERLEQRLAALPGVAGVAAGSARPVLEAAVTQAVAVEGLEPPAEGPQPWAARAVVSTDYFRTLGIPILKGRPFGRQDARGAEPAAVVSQAFASRYLPGREPVGRRVRLGTDSATWLTIVGVAGDVINGDPAEPPRPQVYLSLAQHPVRSLTFFARSRDLESVVGAARAELAQLDPEQPLYDAKTMERALFEDLASNRVVTGLFGTFAVVALGLATVGLYGLISYAVSQRTREIGVRAALGARPGDVLRLVLGQGMRLVAAGLGAGLVVGAGLARVMSSVLVGVAATDPLTFTLVPAALAAVAVLATLLPALRAARLDPAVVLRSE
jgi:putative ABC transport system permease protein